MLSRQDLTGNDLNGPVECTAPGPATAAVPADGPSIRDDNVSTPGMDLMSGDDSSSSGSESDWEGVHGKALNVSDTSDDEV